MRIHGLLLTGGKSTRMGQDKASIQIGNQTLAERVAAELGKVCERVTVLGPNPVRGTTDHLSDEDQYPGPLVAISRVKTDADAVFIASCDLPAFNSELVHTLLSLLDHHDAVMPVLAGREQPLCAIYKGRALESAGALVDQGERRVMTWVDTLNVRRFDVTNTNLAAIVQNANTEAELGRALT